MSRFFGWALILAAGSALAQQPNPVDEHEDPIIQNLPDGKKEPPDTPQTSPKASPQAHQPQTSNTPPSSTGPVVHPPTLDSEEAVLGTWDLVLDKSKFNPGPPPKSEVRTYVRTPDGILATVTTTAADNVVRSIRYRWQANGKEYPVTGSTLLDKIVLSRIDNLTAEATMKHGDKVIASERREFAADGKTMSIEVKDLSSAEHPVISTAVYQKR